MGSVACAGTSCDTWAGLWMEMLTWQKPQRHQASVPSRHQNLSMTCLDNERTQRFVWPQKAPQAFPHQQGGFREIVSEGMWSFNNKSILSAPKQRSAGCPTRETESSADRAWNKELVSLTWVSLETSVSLSDNKMPHTSTHFQESLQNHLMVVRETKLKQI